jgi:hypothetical protein
MALQMQQVEHAEILKHHADACAKAHGSAGATSTGAAAVPRAPPAAAAAAGIAVRLSTPADDPALTQRFVDTVGDVSGRTIQQPPSLSNLIEPHLRPPHAPPHPPHPLPTPITPHSPELRLRPAAAAAAPAPLALQPLLPPQRALPDEAAA